MVKILFIIDRLSLGAGRVLYDLVAHLDNSKFETVVVSLYSEGELKPKFKKLGVKVHYLNKGNGKQLGIILKLKDLIKKEKPDIVHTHNVDAYEYGVIAAKLAGVKKIIHTAHGKSVKETNFKQSIERIYHRLTSLFVTSYVTVSHDLEKYAAENWCLNKIKLLTIHNGVDIKKYKPAKQSREFLRKYGILNSDLLVGIVAGLRPVKDHATLIKAMAIVVNKMKNVKLAIVGDGQEKKNILNLVKELNLLNSVVFLGHRADMVKLYNSFDVGVLSSKSECLSMTLLEGMACGLPFVVTKVGGNPEVVSDCENGYIVPCQSPDMTAEKLLLLLKNKSLREQIAVTNRRKTEKLFNVNSMLVQYSKLYLNEG
jgi:sugar transferase (PEP-CTERM/EpsH1 system associated)